VGRLIGAAAVVALLAVTTASAAAQTGEPVPFKTIERSSGASSGYDGRVTYVIRTKRRWRHVWRHLHAGFYPPPRRPRVRFARSMVIAVLGGSGTATGLRVDSVTRDAGGLLVRATESSPGAGCVVPQVITKPYELVRVARSPASVTTERVERKRDCT
jgi:hypothetical protein